MGSNEKCRGASCNGASPSPPSPPNVSPLLGLSSAMQWKCKIEVSDGIGTDSPTLHLFLLPGVRTSSLPCFCTPSLLFYCVLSFNEIGTRGRVCALFTFSFAHQAMGNCGSSGGGATIEPDPAQKEIAKEIDKLLENDKDEASQIINLLLLGTGGCGKTTFLKQMRMLYGDFLSDDDSRKEWTTVIRENMFSNMSVLCNQLTGA